MGRRGDDGDDGTGSGPADPDPATPEDAAGEDDAGERHRRAARAHFRAAPPYRIQPEEDGRYSLRRER